VRGRLVCFRLVAWYSAEAETLNAELLSEATAQPRPSQDPAETPPRPCRDPAETLPRPCRDPAETPESQPRWVL